MKGRRTGRPTLTFRSNEQNMSVGTRCAGTSCVSAVALLVLGLGRPASAAAQQAITATGTFHSVWVDPRNAPPPDALSFITGEQGTIRLELTAQQLAAGGGRAALERRRVTVTGVVQPAGAAAPGLAAAIAGVPILRVTALRPEQALVSATPQTGSRAYATILCRFPDLASVPGDRARYQAIAGTGEPGLDHYWREVSENQIDLSGSTVSDWYVLPHPYSHYTAGSNLDLGALAQDCTAAADADVNFNQVDGINLQFNAPFAASWGGAWTVSLDGPVRIVPMTWLANWAGQSVYAHEMGHSFGLSHSSGQYGAVYDSPWDVMSYSYVRHVGGTYDYIGQHTITYHKGLLGWIGTRSLSANGSVTR
ncbi:MAG: hypothetical protein M3Y31_10440, partial [Gemmatimonadota bacterium]|nr:hypothetical protein [Gemmatimonadota bacterium]